MHHQATSLLQALFTRRAFHQSGDYIERDVVLLRGGIYYCLCCHDVSKRQIGRSSGKPSSCLLGRLPSTVRNLTRNHPSCLASNQLRHAHDKNILTGFVKDRLEITLFA
jgi:hypothetical protein